MLYCLKITFILRILILYLSIFETKTKQFISFLNMKKSMVSTIIVKLLIHLSLFSIKQIYKNSCTVITFIQSKDSYISNIIIMFENVIYYTILCVFGKIEAFYFIYEDKIMWL